MNEIDGWRTALLDGAGFVLLKDLIPAAEAATARELGLAASTTEPPPTEPLPPHLLRKKAIGHQMVRGLLARGQVFERLIQHPVVVQLVQSILGDDVTLNSYSVRILHPGAGEMGVHIDYPYWAMPGALPVRPPLMVQVIWMLQDFRQDNGATVVAPGTQLLAARPDRALFAAKAQSVEGSAGSAIVSHGLLWHDTNPNRTNEPRVALLANYGMKIIRPLDPNLADLPPEVLARATPLLRQLIGLDLRQAVARDLNRREMYGT